GVSLPRDLRGRDARGRPQGAREGDGPGDRPRGGSRQGDGLPVLPLQGRDPREDRRGGGRPAPRAPAMRGRERPDVRGLARARSRRAVRFFRREPRLLPTLFRLGRVFGGPQAAPEPELPGSHRAPRRDHPERPAARRGEERRSRTHGHRDRGRGPGPHPPAHQREEAAGSRSRRPLPAGARVPGPRSVRERPLMSGPLLCAVDLTDLADGTARFAAVFARVTGSPVTLLHVRERGEAEPAAAARLAALALIIAGTGLTVHTESTEGDPAEAIVRRATALDASAIVMGTHGGHGLERLMLGSVAESVLHRTARPVATLRGPGHAGGPIRKILCGAD